MLLASAFLLALIAATARRGDLHALHEHRWDFPLLPFIALAAQIIAFLPDEAASATARIFTASLHISSYVLILVFVWANRGTRWIWLVGLGLALNAAVILANGGYMPIAPGAVEGGAATEVAVKGVYNNSVLMAKDTRLWYLGDVFRTPQWPVGSRAFSIGDSLIAMGVFGVVNHIAQRNVTSRRRGAP